ncbi:unnamed protein product [Aureobasidium uvarum]|uniref:Aminoglycoside phosphotransferase domain-containing protein n=1 Tax=Aureobasidium uvarum TaxID=2773716 RepID=A0A9N8PQV1_9PEZI|nr:unnamed protein product [Aureobasidium uvarum]
MANDEYSLITPDAFLDRMRNFVATDPFPRNPQISTHSSHADRIEAGYQADGHKTWGFVIYRTTYEDDTDWTEFMRRLRYWTMDNMKFYNGQDVLDRMTWTIFDNRERFDGADVSTIRQHFRNWAEKAARAEQQQPEEADDKLPSMGRSPRYRYCIQVDADALKSAVYDAPPPPDFDKDKQGWVNLIDKDWLPRSKNPIYAGRQPDPNVYEPIYAETTAEVHVTQAIYRNITRVLDGQLKTAALEDCLRQRRLIRKFLIPELNDSLWVMVHADLSASNIITDEDYNISG